MTRYSFNDHDEKIEVYADGVWECKLVNGAVVDIAKSKEEHKSLEVPLYIKIMVYANNVNIKTLRSIGIPGNLIQLYKNDELLWEI
ncbi:hypothetical protein CEXT_63071 [Caerostris extrusa]|uniref:Uncharacterized protein n=1 Tax=Caerostris extrusa TaxID=172846 RepID=A0AAV4PM60_CAEEX|nr:hypothetical protein CEXT_63071 [Caerostris extrusa]